MCITWPAACLAGEFICKRRRACLFDDEKGASLVRRACTPAGRDQSITRTLSRRPLREKPRPLLSWNWHFRRDDLFRPFPSRSNCLNQGRNDDDEALSF